MPTDRGFPTPEEQERRRQENACWAARKRAQLEEERERRRMADEARIRDAWARRVVNANVDALGQQER